MEIQWLREYVQLCKTLNYRKAAEQLFITPSTLSKHVILIEKELDAQLLVRDTRSVSLTESGRLFRDSAVNVLRELDMVSSQLSRGSSVQGELRIGGGLRFTKLNEIIYPMVSHFEKKYPDVNLYVEDIQYHDYREDLMKNAFDIVFSLRLPTMNEEGLAYHDLFTLPLCAWVAGGNRYADAEAVTLAQLSEQRLRILEEERCPAYAAYLRDLFAARGLPLRVGKSLNQAMALDGDSFGITPEFVPTSHFGFGMGSIPIADGEDVLFSLVRRSGNPNPIVDLFYEEFTHAYG